ncbi:MAG: class I SAM-dependent rRNA methyltransferase [Bacteroidia bacterium]
MNEFPRLILNKGKDAAIRRMHPWVFSGAIHHAEGDPKDGDTVWIANKQGTVLATGHYHQGNITARLFAFSQVEPDAAFWNAKIQRALDLRTNLQLADSTETNAYRLIHAEGDGLPGLIIDMYNGVAVVQAHSIGMHKARHMITDALKACLGDRLTAVYDVSAKKLPKDYGMDVENAYLYGEASVPMEVSEHGYRFLVDWEKGQKTGFFLDQRDNRDLLRRYSEGKRVLNTFCYTGGFSVYSLAAGASHVDSVDASAGAMELCEQNIALNESTGEHHAHTSDVLAFLKENEEPYDTIILDPPAYAKNIKSRHRAVIGYKRLNIAGIKALKPGGILFTFSCSQVVNTLLFQNTVMAAALECGREVQILHRLSQPSDHPVSLFHPEGQYLKGLVLKVL